MRIIQDISDFIFVNDKPQKADIIFLPGGSALEPKAHPMFHGRTIGYTSPTAFYE